MPDKPRIRRRYRGDFTNTDRWDQFVGKPGDVFVSTPPKCGTTWTTTIVTMLCHGKTDVAPTELVQWIDADVVPIEEAIGSLDAQSHRRCIKSHTPFDGIPYSEDATYIAVYRHPIDMLFSLRKHTENWKDAPPDHPHFGDADSALKDFVEQKVDVDNYDEGILEAIVGHYRSFTKTSVLENVLVLHYAGMLADPRGAIESIAIHMGLDRNADLLDAVHKETSFGNMKAQADRFAPFADRGFWHDSSAFFDSAGTRKWAGKLSEASLDLYQDRIAELLTPEELAWLEGGHAS